MQLKQKEVNDLRCYSYGKIGISQYENMFMNIPIFKPTLLFELSGYVTGPPSKMIQCQTPEECSGGTQFESQQKHCYPDIFYLVFLN
jgi:hypothetical protein